ncbi:MAG TPA: cyanophycin synthetase, partial [Gemmatimonadaceae bacterium]|nr:cyanophycin synthetase [Gemmatimonadaceae bacterium]
FTSVKRRMEVRGEVRGVTVIDDFAHHPTAIRETIDAVRQKYKGRRIVAVYEPRSYTAQRREFQDDYARAFGGADEVIFASLYRPDRYTKETALDLAQLVRDLSTDGRSAKELKDADAIVRDLAPRTREKDVVLIMSNGGFGGIHQKLLDALTSR